MLSLEDFRDWLERKLEREPTMQEFNAAWADYCDYCYESLRG